MSSSDEESVHVAQKLSVSRGIGAQCEARKMLVPEPSCSAYSAWLRFCERLSSSAAESAMVAGDYRSRRNFQKLRGRCRLGQWLVAAGKAVGALTGLA